MNYHVYCSLKGSYFQIFGDRKYGLFSSQKVDGKMIVTEYWKVLVLNFSKMGYTVFFGPKNWWKDDIYWLLESSCFELFGDGKYGLFFSEKIDKKMVFTDYGTVLGLSFSVFFFSGFNLWNCIIKYKKGISNKRSCFINT